MWNLIEKVPKFFRFSRSATQTFFPRSTMVTDIFEDFKPHSEKMLPTPLGLLELESEQKKRQKTYCFLNFIKLRIIRTIDDVMLIAIKNQGYYWKSN